MRRSRRGIVSLSEPCNPDGMHRFCIYTFVLAALLCAAEPYETEVSQWRLQQEQELKSDSGWLTVAGLFWLKEGVNSAGSATSNGIVLPRGPAKLGEFNFRSGQVTFQPAAGVSVNVNGKPAVAATKLTADSEGKPDQIELDGLTLFVIHRGDRYGIRLRDLDSKLRKDFSSRHWFPVKPDYRVTAKFVAYDPPNMIAVPNVLGETSQMPSPGYVQFTLEGHELRLDPVVEDESLFFIFRDETSGKGTYPPGRFLHADFAKDGKVTLDFNKAYNPPCAFTPYATCPLPPKQNRLPLGIEAGEQFTGSAHASP
jgi:uncharacterized protein (DUF1684 family)